MQVVTEGDYVLFQLPHEGTKLLQVKKDTLLHFGKYGKAKGDQVVGLHYGHAYEMNPTKGLSLVEPDLHPIQLSVTRDNREILPESNAQKLSSAEILELKDALDKGERESADIIEKLIENSVSFDMKNEYAQVKYIKKKQKKYLRAVKLIRPSLLSLAWHFFETNQDKIKGLRMDTLSQLLSYSGIRPGTRVLMVDETGGLLAGAVLERLHGQGSVKALTFSKRFNHDIVNYFNFSPEQRRIFHPLAWSEVLEYLEVTPEALPEAVSDPGGGERRKRKLEHLSEMSLGSFDALLVVSVLYDPLVLLKTLERYLRPSRGIVLFHPNKEPLLPVFMHCRQSPRFVNVSLTESWMREYQVLPGRMHPNMKMSGSGGFLLSMITVLEDVPPS